MPDVRDLLHDAAGEPAAPLDLLAVLRAGARRTARRRVLAASAAVLPVAVAAVVLLGLPGSGGTDRLVPAAPPTARTTAPSPVPHPGVLPAGPGTTGPTTPGGPPAPPATSPPPSPTPSRTTTVAGLTLFALPSGNIGCALDGGTARCDIRDRTWQPPAKPASCDVDFGNGLSVGTGRAGFVCAGDTVLGGAPLAYGQALRSGDVVCTSSPAGVTCTNLTTRRGFTLSRTAYRLF